MGLIFCPVTCYLHLWLPERREQITANSAVRLGSPLGLDQSTSSNAPLALYPDLSHRGPFFLFTKSTIQPATMISYLLLSLSKRPSDREAL